MGNIYGTLTGTITVRGVAYEAAYMDTAEVFVALVDDVRVTSTSWNGLSSAINTELRRREVTVEVAFVHPETGRRGTVTRMHGGRALPMIVWADGTKSTEDIYGPLTHDTDGAELVRLIKAHREAGCAVDAFRHNHSLSGTSLARIVQAEIGRVVAERDTAERAAGATDLDADAVVG